MYSVTAIQNSYVSLLSDIKQRIQAARSRAALAVNAELIRLYWDIGRTLLVRRELEGWGGKVVARLASDLKEAFPTMKGLSSSNLKYMRYFAECCPDLRIGQQAADQLPWFHLVTLLTKVDREGEREWLCYRAVREGWSRATLEANIENRLFDRQGQAVNNMEKPLGISEYQLLRALPEHLDTSLPTIEALEEALSGELELNASEGTG